MTLQSSDKTAGYPSSYDDESNEGMGQLILKCCIKNAELELLYVLHW